MRKADMRAWLEELQVQRQELDTVIAYVQKQLGIQPSTNGKQGRKRAAPKPKNPDQRGQMPTPDGLSYRQFVGKALKAGYTMAEVGPAWQAHKAIKAIAEKSG